MANGETGGNPQVRSSTTGGARVCAVNASTSGSGLDEGELAGDARVGVATEKSSRRGVKHCQFHEGRAIVSKRNTVRAQTFYSLSYHSPDNRALARECKDVNIDRVYIGSCTGGKTKDFLAAARQKREVKLQEELESLKESLMIERKILAKVSMERDKLTMLHDEKDSALEVG
ncbi:hypothetical protein Dimus_008293 [Dionaea muscipula]